MNYPKTIIGPALITYRSQTYFTTGDITVNFERATTDIITSQHGRVDTRDAGAVIRLSCNVIGLADALDTILFHFAGFTPGESLTPGIGVGISCTGEADNETITAAAHGLTDGERVVFKKLTGGTGWAVDTVYYVRDAATNTFKIASTAGGSAVAISADATAPTIIHKVEETPLVIYPLTNAGGTSLIWTFPRCGLVGIGNLTMKATAPTTCDLKFTALESEATEGTWATNAAWSAPSSTILDDFSASQISCDACRLSWAANPASITSGEVDMVSEDGWTVNLEFPVKEHPREAYGICEVTAGAGGYNVTVTGKAATIYDHNGQPVPEANWQSLMPFGSARPGQRSERKKLTLTRLYDSTSGIAAGTALITFSQAEWTMLSGAWGSESNRSGSVTFKCIPVITSGVRAVDVISNYLG
jgi:hypothetical protein